uniref:Uncharacterized protein n=1 Tax=Arundo donax TaxID=35708 RepID=A0A0A8Y2Q3_ARUDO
MQANDILYIKLLVGEFY